MNDFNDIRERSLLQWLLDMEKNEDIAVRGGVRLAREYMQYLKDENARLVEENELKNAFLKKLSRRTNGAIKGIHHVSLKCTDAEQAKVCEFYGETLGLKVKRAWADGIMYDAGNSLVEIFFTGEGIKEQGAVRHFAFAVKNVDSCVERIVSAGYEVFMGPKDITIPSEPALDARVAFLIGPLGEEIELFSEK